MWKPDEAKALAYQASALLRMGWSSRAVALPDVESGKLVAQDPQKDWPALVVYAWAINLQKGDVVMVTLTLPDGKVATNGVTLDRNKAQYFLFAGKKLPIGGWQTGNYQATFSVLRQGNDVLRQHMSWQN